MSYSAVPDWWLWGLLILSFLLTVWLDFRSRPNKRRLIRIFAILLVFISTIGVLIEPSIYKTVNKDLLVISTDGTDESRLDSLEDLNYQIMDFHEFEMNHSRAKSALVTGFGLKKWQLEQMDIPFEYVSAKRLPEGPIELLSRAGEVNVPMAIQVNFNLEEDIAVVLSGPGIETKSKAVRSDQAFEEWNVIPKVTGDYVFRLEGIRSNDTIFSEKVPIKIREFSKKNVLMITQAPSFELRSLKNYLGENGFGVAERYSVSRDIFRTTFSNMTVQSLNRVTKSMLKPFNLVVIDRETYAALSRSEKSNLKTALRSGRIGIVWIGNDDSDLVILKSEEAGELTFKGYNGSVELEKTGRTLDDGTPIRVQESQIGSTTSYGLGQIAISEIQNSYTLLLKGEEKLYSEIWQSILNPVSGSRWERLDMKFQERAIVDEPTTVLIQNPGILVEIDGKELPMEELWYRSGFYRAKYWPKRSGWHVLKTERFEESFYVFDRNERQAQHAHEASVRTSLKSQENENVQETVEVEVPTSKWLFLAGFLIGFGCLWVEQRLG